MLQDSIIMVDGSDADNLAIVGGTGFPGTTSPGELFFRTDEDKLYMRNAANSDWVDLAASGGADAVTKYKAATTTRSLTTTLADDPELAGFALEASSFYLITGTLLYSMDNAAADFKYGWTKSAATVGDQFAMMAAQSSSLGGIQEFVGGLTSIKTIDVTATGSRHAVLSGYVSTSGATTLDFQWAQGTSTATNTRLIIGSWVTFTKVA